MLERYSEPYVEAQNNNLNYIKDFLNSYPQAINHAIGDQAFSQERTNNFINNKLKLTAISTTVVIGIIAFPYLASAAVLLGTELASIAWLINENNETELELDRKGNWTLLEFAAQGNAIEVAEYLILNGADLNNNFITIATQNKYFDFITACSNAIKQRNPYITIDINASEGHESQSHDSNSSDSDNHDSKKCDSASYESESYSSESSDSENDDSSYKLSCKRLDSDLSHIKTIEIQYKKDYISKGAYGSIYKALIKNHNEDVAIKIFQADPVDGHDDSKREIIILDFLTKHKTPNVITFYGYHYNKPTDKYFMAMEYMRKGNLDNLIHKSTKSFPLNLIVHYLAGIAQGLHCIHHYKIVHRDLKLNNILLNDDNEAILCDFGLSVRLDIDKIERDIAVAYWRAPETIFKGDIRIEGDIYALAYVAWSFITLKTTPFLKDGEKYDSDSDIMNMRIKEKLLTNKRPSFFSKFSSETYPRLEKLICTMWTEKPRDRPNAAQVLDKLAEMKI
jgi:tRNA A-37 threonylcarbamoyl transferase component Bud32